MKQGAKRGRQSGFAPIPMRLTISEPAAAPDLLEFLLARVDCIAHQVSEDEIDVSILGSRRTVYNDLELETRLHAWRATHPGVEVRLPPKR